MKKFFSFLMVMLLGVGIFAGCKKGDDCKDCVKTGDMTLTDINKLLNSEQFWSGYRSDMAIIPFNHIDGPKNEWKFYAVIHFQFKSGNIVKYQVSYLSCTCRDKIINYWSTAYVELSIPTKPQNTRIKALSYETDLGVLGQGHYNAGYWGDSDPIPNGTTYQDIKDEFIPLLIDKTKAQIDSYNTVDEMKTEGALSQDLYDSFTGASVSTNNMLRMLQALMNYHVENYVNK